MGVTQAQVRLSHSTVPRVREVGTWMMKQGNSLHYYCHENYARVAQPNLEIISWVYMERYIPIGTGLEAKTE